MGMARLGGFSYPNRGHTKHMAFASQANPIQPPAPRSIEQIHADFREREAVKQSATNDNLATQSARQAANRQGEDPDEIADRLHEPPPDPDNFKTEDEQFAFNF